MPVVVRVFAVNRRLQLKKLRGFALDVLVPLRPFVPLWVTGGYVQPLCELRHQLGLVRLLVASPSARPVRLFGRKQLKRLFAQLVTVCVPPRPRHLFPLPYWLKRFNGFNGKHPLVPSALRLRLV